MNWSRDDQAKGTTSWEDKMRDPYRLDPSKKELVNLWSHVISAISIVHRGSQSNGPATGGGY